MIKKTGLVIALTACLAFILFKLFEPIFVYGIGWSSVDNNSKPELKSEYSNHQWQAKSQQADTIVSKFYNETNTPAVSVAISVDGNIVWRAATGYADLENQTPITFNDTFRIGSTSKALTSILVGTLVDQGMISLSNKLRDIDPSISDNLKDITLADALSHRAGIRNYGVCFCFPIWEHQNTKRFKSVRDSVSVIEHSKLQSTPGEEYSYSSFGFNLAGAAIEKVSGRTFQGAMTHYLLKPIEVNNTYLEDQHKNVTPTAKPYEIDNGRYKPTFGVEQSIRWPSGGFISTPSDMVKLGNTMLNNSLLSDEVRTALLTVPAKGRNNGGKIYALGWRVSNWAIDDKTSLKSYHHDGVSVGGISSFVVFPNERMVISAMTNKNGTNSKELRKLIKQLVPVFIEEKQPN